MKNIKHIRLGPHEDGETSIPDKSLAYLILGCFRAAAEFPQFPISIDHVEENTDSEGIIQSFTIVTESGLRFTTTVTYDREGEDVKEQKLPNGQSLIGFSSLEEMLEYQAAQEQASIAQTLPEQWEITYGDYVFRLTDDLAIFGHIFTGSQFLGDHVRGETEHDEEIFAEWEDIKSSYERGYRYGKWYSQVEPTGEYGSTHVVSIWKITQTDFERARLANWQLWPELARKLSAEIRRAHFNQEGTE